MRRGVYAGVFVAALLLAVCSALGQTVTDIETRGTDPTFGDYKVRTGGGGGRGAGTDALSVGFSLVNGSTLPIGQIYDYEVTVTNKSTKEVRLPRCIEWSDIVDDHPKELRYETLEIVVVFHSPQTGNAYMGGNLLLYGRSAKPSTMIALLPGDTLRLRGRVKLEAPWLPIPANSVISAKMRAAVSLSDIWLHPTPTPEAPDGYSQDPKEIYFVKSENVLPVVLTTNEALEFPPKQKASAPSN
jgi:hypothetical protein